MAQEIEENQIPGVVAFDGSFGVDPQYLDYLPRDDLAKPEVGTEAFPVKEEPKEKSEELVAPKEPAIKKPIRKVKVERCESDDDYKPVKRKESRPKKTLQQRDSRNNIPNSVHHLLVYIQREFKSGRIVRRIFAHSCPDTTYTPSRFYLFQKILKTRINNYVNEETLKRVLEPGHILSGEFPFLEQFYYCRVARALIRYFLKTESVPMVLRSKKVRPDNRGEHLNVQRYLYEDLIAS